MEKTPWYKQKTFWAGVGAGLLLAAILVCLDSRYGRQAYWRGPVSPYEQMDWDFDQDMMQPVGSIRIPDKPISDVRLESGMMGGSGQMMFNFGSSNLAMPYEIKDNQLNLDLSRLAKYMKENPNSKVNLTLSDKTGKTVLDVKSSDDLKNEQLQFAHKPGMYYHLNLQMADENGKSMVAIEQTI